MTLDGYDLWRAGLPMAIDSGIAVLVSDPGRAAAWTLVVDGLSQSFVDLHDPTYLRFPYVRRIAAVIDAAAPDGVPLRVLHLGGGGMTLPRYVAATRPASWQCVIEKDRTLVDLVRDALPVGDVGIRVVVADAPDLVAGMPSAEFDLVIGDAYCGAEVAYGVAAPQFVAAVRRVLRPSGRYLLNILDEPPMPFVRGQVALLRQVFGEVCVVGEPGVVWGGRYGNVVLAAAREAGGLPMAGMAVTASRDPYLGRLLAGDELDDFVASALAVDSAMSGAVDSSE